MAIDRAIHRTPLHPLYVEVEAREVTLMRFLAPGEYGAFERRATGGESDATRPVDAAAFADPGYVDEVFAQVDEYLAGERRAFGLACRLEGTPFQLRVWHAMGRIPYGETRTYGQLAAEVGSPKGFRAVGMACNRNPVALILPCHRVVGAGGRLVGYAGGVDVKEALLALEARVVRRSC